MTTCSRKELFTAFIICIFVNCSQFVCACVFPFGFKGGMCDSIVLIHDHCLSFNFASFTKWSYSNKRSVPKEVLQTIRKCTLSEFRGRKNCHRSLAVTKVKYDSE